MNTGILSSSQNQKIKKWYSIFNFIVRFNKNVDFLNLGYTTINQSTNLRDRQIQLYKELLSSIDLTSKSIAEIGCGFGGGNIVIKEFFRYNYYVGFDTNPYSIERCNQKLSDQYTHFCVSDYKNFITHNRKYDIIISLEASLHFEDISLFFENVSNSLVKNGKFLYGDIFVADELESIQKKILANNFTIERCSDVTNNIIKSIETNTNLSFFQRVLHYIFLEKGNLGFTKKSTFYNRLCKKELRYVLFTFSKNT